MKVKGEREQNSRERNRSGEIDRWIDRENA